MVDKPAYLVALLMVLNSSIKLWNLSYTQVVTPLVLTFNLGIVYLLTGGVRCRNITLTIILTPTVLIKIKYTFHDMLVTQHRYSYFVKAG